MTTALQNLRRVLIGSPLPSWRSVHERLPKVLALPIFASDALSSVAYATEEILLILVLAGSMLLTHPMVLQISVAIVVLLAIVVTSYRQTIRAYPSGGGAYIVARENLGNAAGLAAGSALTIDYTLTVAVSVAAGVAAVVSAYPSLIPYRVELAVGGVLLLMLANLRGVRESGFLFAVPTYLFIFSMLGLIFVGLYRLWTGSVLTAPATGMHVPAVQSLSLFLILRAFSGGCAAMTGTEAISNAVPAFRPPESKNAAVTLTVMGSILGVLFIGIGYLAWRIDVVPFEPGHEGYQTVVSQLARAVFGGHWYYFLIQAATAVILLLAANTSFAGFPRLAAIMARDRFMPRQLYNVGDKLVFNNGIILLSLMAILLIVVFHGDTHSLIPLYAVGVFLSFTLSQAGMVKRFAELREPGWRRSAVISGVGAFATGVVTLVLATTKFRDGAWVVVILIPALAGLFWKVNQHYVELGNRLRLSAEDSFIQMNNTVLVLTPSLHKGILPALEYAKGLSTDVRAVHIETDQMDTALLKERWERWGGGLPLVILESPYRSLVKPLLDYLEEVKQEREDYRVTVVIPEIVPAKWWHTLLHNRSGFLLRLILLGRRDIVTASVRYFVDE